MTVSVLTVQSTAERRFLRLPAAAEYIGQTERFMRRLVAERRIRFYKVGKFVTFDRADLDEFAELGRVEPIGGLTWAVA